MAHARWATLLIVDNLPYYRLQSIVDIHTVCVVLLSWLESDIGGILTGGCSVAADPSCLSYAPGY